MKTSRRAFFVAGAWLALLSTSAAQEEPKREPAPPVKPAGPEAAPAEKKAPAAAQVQQRVIIGGGAVQGQVIVNGGVLNINGGNVVIAGNGWVSAEDGSEQPKVEPDPAGAQIIDYADGQRLHGTLSQLDPAGGQLLWQRSDTPAPLAIPLAQISRWSRDESPAPASAATATVKFAGGDWLAGNIVAIQGDEVHLQLPDGSPIKTTRNHIEWIYFSKSGAVETYDGPTSLAGWTSAGNWTYRDGALRASSPSAISRHFQALPDRVEYRLIVNQGEAFNAFTVSLHSGHVQRLGVNLLAAQVMRWRGSMIQVMLRANTLNVWGPIDGNFKSVQVDLSKVLGDVTSRPKAPMLFRIFEDYTAGKLSVYINQHKAGEWTLDKGEPGKNGGAFQFQPTSWSGESEQSISMIRILPWDGRPPGEDDERARDSVSIAGGASHRGKVTGWDGKVLTMTSDNGPVSVTGEQIELLRFQRPANPPDDGPPVAHVRLAGRGEFDAVKLDWRDGKFQVGTNFGGTLPLDPAALAELEFNRAAPSQSLTAENVLVFRNGDRLRGTLEAAGDDGKIRWRTSPAGPPAEFTATNVAGLQLKSESSGESGKMVARFRNGDWLGGNFVTLDRQQVVLDAEPVGQITAPRAAVKALYFGTNGAPAVSDGVSDHTLWERGLDLGAGTTAARKKAAEAGSPWSYFAGTFARSKAANNDAAFNRTGGIQLGRFFERMTPRVEMSFKVSTEQNPVYFSAQLFTEPANSGYMMHLSSGMVSVYDMNPRARAGRGFAQQQFPFPKELNPSARVRHIRLFADRPTGRVTIMVDGVVTAQIAPKTGDGQRNLGRGLMISPQPNMACKFSDLWVGPWNGILPGKTPDNAPETVALANGDEVQGTVELATPTTVKMASDVGALDLPMERLTMIDLGGPPIERPNATRLHLAGQGSLTVSSWRIEGRTLTCRSEVIGEVKLPLQAVQEIVFATAPVTPTATAPGPLAPAPAAGVAPLPLPVLPSVPLPAAPAPGGPPPAK